MHVAAHVPLQGGVTPAQRKHPAACLRHSSRLLAAAGPKVRHQAPAATYARHCARLLENQGSWEAARGHITGGRAPPCMPPTAEAWEGLGQHAPELAEVAVAAADVASSLQYFEVRVAGGLAVGFAGDGQPRGWRWVCWAGWLGRMPPSRLPT